MPDDVDPSSATVAASPSGAEPTAVASPSGVEATQLAHGTENTGSRPTPAMATSGGATLARLDTERYRLGELLGKGGMGEVVLAYDEQLGREVAIKRIRAEIASGELLSRFLREARVQGRLQHPAVVPVHDLAFDKDGYPYFVMKRLAGTTLADLMRAETPDRNRLLRAFVDVCLAIEFAHNAGIVHRDLKPANIMLGDFGEVYVLDWGVARALAETSDDEHHPPTHPPTRTAATSGDLQLASGETQLGTVLGTPTYMAPEQLAGDRAGPAADVYALGCILFEIVSGRVLHDGRRSLSSLVDPPDAKPSGVKADAPPELDAICMRATALEPTERFATPRALGDAVQAFMDGDRDLALRKQHARKHIEAAREALARDDSEEARRTAMREAGRALVLDPTANEAADIVTGLVLRPPHTVPREVQERLVQLDTETGRTHGKLAAWSTVGYLGFVPMLLWTGVRDMRFVIALALLAITLGVQVWNMTRREDVTSRGIYASAVLNGLLIFTVCRIVGPFVIAPTLVMTTLMVYAAHPRFGSMPAVAAILAGALVLPWLLEIAGVLDATYRFTDSGELVLSSHVIAFSSIPVQLSFLGLLVMLVALVAILTRGMARRQWAAAQTIELQAWHLRQLVPQPVSELQRADVHVASRVAPSR